MRTSAESFRRRLGIAMSNARLRIPPENRRKFDAEAADFYREISAAVEFGNEERAGQLLAQWNRRAGMAAGHGWHHAPPCLVQQEGETNDQWIARCYEAMP